MTLAAATPVNSYVGNSASNTYSFTFDTFLQTDLQVTVTSPASVVTTLALGTDYTVAGLSPSGSPASSGTITLVNNGQAWLTSGNLTTGWTLTIQRVVPLSQTSSIRNQGDYYPEFLEDTLDRIEMQIQQLQVQINTFQAEIVAIDALIATMQTQIGTLQTQVGTLQTQVSTLQSQVASIQAQLSSTGLILVDIVNGNSYKLFMSGGVLDQQQQ